MLEVWNDLRNDLKDLKKQCLFRSLETILSKKPGARLGRFVDFSSNDYLGLSTHREVIRKSAEALRLWGAGSGASRLISGNLKVHSDLENKIASFKKEEAATIFSSGYLANLGALSALLNEKDLVLLDRLNHASLVDAARLCKAKLWVYPHKDVNALAELLSRVQGFRRTLVATDAYFSMDGDVAPLDRLYGLCEKNGAMLMVDEAHSTGVFGKNGRGLTEHFHLEKKIDVVMGTLSKALGSVGGFVAGRALLNETPVTRSREFIYTTAPSPAASAAALASLELIEKDGSLRKKLWDNAAYLRKGLQGLGFGLMDSEGPVIPIVVGDPVKAVRVKEFMKKENLLIAAVRAPTVPRGTDRLRISVSAAHSTNSMDLLLKALKKARDKFL